MEGVTRIPHIGTVMGSSEASRCRGVASILQHYFTRRTTPGAVISPKRSLTETEMRKTAFTILTTLLIAGSLCKWPPRQSITCALVVGITTEIIADPMIS
jgi:hypothetical protein